MKPLLLVALLCLTGCADIRDSLIVQLEEAGRAGNETGN